MKSLGMGICAGLVTIAIGVTWSNAQLKFADGSVQNSAAGRSGPAPGSAFAEVVVSTVPALGSIQVGPQVPAGKELVVRQIDGQVDSIGDIWIVRSQNAPNNPSIWKDLLRFYVGAGGTTIGTRTYPDGTVVVDEGNYLAFFNNFGSSPQNLNVTVLGYYRDKI